MIDTVRPLRTQVLLSSAVYQITPKLKQHTFFISWFLYIRNSRLSQLGGSGSGSEVAIRTSAKGFTSASKVVHTPDAWQRPQFLAAWASPWDSWGPCYIVAGFLQSRRPKEKAKQKPGCILWSSFGSDTPSPLPYSNNHREQPWFIMEGDYARAWIPRVGYHWGPSWRLAATSFYGSGTFSEEKENVVPTLEQILLIYLISSSGFNLGTIIH